MGEHILNVAADLGLRGPVLDLKKVKEQPRNRPMLPAYVSQNKLNLGALVICSLLFSGNQSSPLMFNNSGANEHVAGLIRKVENQELPRRLHDLGEATCADLLEKASAHVHEIFGVLQCPGNNRAGAPFGSGRQKVNCPESIRSADAHLLQIVPIEHRCLDHVLQRMLPCPSKPPHIKIH